MRLHDMDSAPRDGSPIRLFAEYAPQDGIVCRWRTIEQLFQVPSTAVSVGNERGGAWVSSDGIAVFDWQGWLPEPPADQ